jgi:hypothetical protein
MIKAAIFMGDPMYHYGLSYDVGTCTAGGVSQPSLLPNSTIHRRIIESILTFQCLLDSSTPAPPDSVAQAPQRSNLIVTLLIHTAATEAMLLLIKAMVPSMAVQLLPLSSRSSVVRDFKNPQELSRILILRTLMCSLNNNCSTATSSTTTTAGTSPTSTTTSAGATGTSTTCVAEYGQCGGSGWTGGTTCCSGSTCSYYSTYYSQCLA